MHFARRRGPIAAWPAALGLGVVHAITIGQSFAVVALALALVGNAARDALGRHSPRTVVPAS